MVKQRRKFERGEERALQEELKDSEKVLWRLRKKWNRRR